GPVPESLPYPAPALAARRERPPGPAVPRARASDDRLTHLSELHSTGLLTDAEYATLRARFAAGA
ncbi:hypothetical protein ACFVHW_22605, partial [Streptomyces sp. NPDC127110]